MIELLTNYFQDFFFMVIVETALFLYGLYAVLNPTPATPVAKRGIRREIEKTRKWGVFYMIFAVVVMIASISMYARGIS